ncbi:hypothetical protein PHYPSEUDO_007652 [Phytophthora pseudosyringae]|uniref:Uncharacterized protein n=1 Tax=Phytophthora pseudosyringae TaxID=221518 RepID=A0A8T1VG02_9STRA|nr:hypothetical protein PHYPSEUDO_007652 [Phytophthora pseudosyringae]
MMTVLPLADTTATASKKRRRSIEPVDSSKILALPLSMSPRAMASGPVRAALQQHTAKRESEELLRRSLMGLSLQLKLKMILVEAWASDMNSVVMERNLFAIAKELAILKEMGVYEQHTCVRFLELARNRMAQLLEQTERRESLHMEAEQMWTMALIQAQEAVSSPPNSPSAVSEFPLLSGFDASSRDISVLWRAMSIARDRGAQLWHENKPEQALPFLLAADSYMKRFTLKYQRLKVDHAMVDTLQKPPMEPKRSPTRVSFAEEPQVMGIADAEVDRTPICPTKPSKLESLLLRTSREFPTPPF